eukprot:Gb_30214 [translate_table: standard]
MGRNMKGSAELSMSFLLLVLVCLLFSECCHVSAAQRGRQEEQQPQQEQSCRIERLSAQEPSQRIRSEGGSLEFLNIQADNDQFQCAGVTAIRETLDPNALLLPTYTNSPKIAYIVQGNYITFIYLYANYIVNYITFIYLRANYMYACACASCSGEGRLGVVFPGCPETFQEHSFHERREEERGSEGGGGQGTSQKVRRVRRGDVVAIPAGVVCWLYNDGNERLQIVAIADTSNHQNQLDQTYRPFYLAGSAPSGGQIAAGGRSIGDNILQGFDTETLAEAMGISQDTARRIQQNQKRGPIVKVEGGLRVPGPRSERETDYLDSTAAFKSNSVEEFYCSMRLSHNADNPEDADVYVRNGGRLNRVDRLKIPALRDMRLGAERAVLHPEAMFAPSWLMNAHGVMYVTRGRGRIQIVANEGRRVFEGEVREGQFLVIPQFHAIVKQAGTEGLEWITFTTSNSPSRSSLTGRNSVFKAMPQEVVMNAFKINEKDAQDLRSNRHHETIILSPPQ